jgi:hypothetical protein
MREITHLRSGIVINNAGREWAWRGGVGGVCSPWNKRQAEHGYTGDTGIYWGIQGGKFHSEL